MFSQSFNSSNVAPPARLHFIPQHTSLPSDREGEQLIPTPSDEHLQLWIRADTLRPLHISEGEALLVNNLTGLSEDERVGKQIAQWSLHLCLRERATIAIRTGYNLISPLPLDASNILSWSSLAQERSAKSIQEANNWMSRVDESTSFDSGVDMIDDMETNDQGNEHQMQPFRAIMPAVEFPGSRVDQHTGSRRKHIDLDDPAAIETYYKCSSLVCADNIKYNIESEFSYYAKVHLKDGTIVRVPCGRSSAIPTLIEDAPIETRPAGIRLETRNDYVAAPGMSQPSHFQLDISLDLPIPCFVRGHTYTTTGQIQNNLDSDQLVPMTIQMQLTATVSSHWVKEMAEKYRSDLTPEVKLAHKTQHPPPMWKHYEGKTSLPSAGLLVEEELSILRKDNLREIINEENDRRSLHWTQGTIDESLSSFAVVFTVEENSLTTHSSVFEEVELMLKVSMTVARRKKLGNKLADYQKDQWELPLIGYIPITVLGSRQNFETTSDPDLRGVLQTWRRSMTKKDIRHYLQPDARMPILVNEMDARKLIAMFEDEENFPLLSTVMRKKETIYMAGQDEPFVPFQPLGFLQPKSYGSADQDVNVAWANQVLLPRRLEQCKEDGLKAQTKLYKSLIEERQRRYQKGR